MSEATVLFYGTPGHPVLEPLCGVLRERARRRVVFVPQEKFPREVALALGAGEHDAPGWIIPPYEEAVPLDQVCGACLDGYAIGAERFSDLEEADVAYAQAECWAALIALFGRLSRTAVIANHVTRRTFIASRAAGLAHLARHGLAVPRVLVTSDPAAAQAFYEAVGERAIYKPVGGAQARFKAMGEVDLERLDAIRLAPVHFEEAPAGELVQAIVIGRQVLPLSTDTGEVETLPDEVATRCLSACRALDLVMGQVSLRRHGDAAWTATGLVPHLSPESLAVPSVVEAAARVLEEGGSALS